MLPECFVIPYYLTCLVILDIESSRKEQNGGLELLSPLQKKTGTKMHTFFCLKESFCQCAKIFMVETINCWCLI